MACIDYRRRPAAGRGTKDYKLVTMSFETGEQAVVRLFVPGGRIRVLKLRGISTKAIAGTNAGTVTAANATGAMTSGVLTWNASAPINTEVSASPTGANAIIAQDSYIQLTAAKTTAGGKVLVQVDYEFY